MILTGILLAVSAASFAWSLYQSYKMAKAMRAAGEVDTASEFSAPSTDVTKSIPVIFGTRDVIDPLLAWYGNVEKINASPDYWKIGAQFVLGYGPLKRLSRIKLDEKDIWISPQSQIVSSGTITVEGSGVFNDGSNLSGEIGVMQGTYTNTVDSYLADKLANALTFPNLISLIYRGVNVGENPNLRKPSFRITCQPDDYYGVYWYPTKASILTPEKTFDVSIVSAGSGGGEVTGAIRIYPGSVSTDPILLTYEIFLDGSGGQVNPTVRFLPDGFSSWTEDAFYTKEFTDDTSPSDTLEIPVKYLQYDNPVIYFNITYNAGQGYESATFSAALEQIEDCNPAHIIYSCLVNPVWGLGLSPTNDLDLTSFQNCADTLYDEQFGLSVKWSKSTSVEKFVQEILRHAGAVLFVDNSTGKYVLKLIRDDYSVANLPTLDKTNIVSMDSWKRSSVDDLLNTVTVTYYDTRKGASNGVTISDVALVQSMGKTVATTIDFPAISNAVNASKVAQREGVVSFKPLLSVTLKAKFGVDLNNIGDVFILDWPKYWPDPIIMRVTKISIGDGRNNVLTISATEDIYTFPPVAYVTD